MSLLASQLRDDRTQYAVCTIVEFLGRAGRPPQHVRANAARDWLNQNAQLALAIRNVNTLRETADRSGMTWSGFRPSDDACTYGYNIPSNLFAAQALLAIAEIAEIADEVYHDAELSIDARDLSRELVVGVEAHGIVEHDGTRIYAYEVDGLGGFLCMDDANTPSLLSLPLIAPKVIDTEVWRATRAFALSTGNPYYFAGRVASGIGSPHTKAGYVWPIALAVEGLTGTAADRERLLRLVADTDADTGRIHESFDCSDPTAFSRPWFSWADSMFCELEPAVADDVETAARQEGAPDSAWLWTMDAQ